MYNINLATPQVFEASADNELYFQSWSSNVKQPLKVFYIIGSAIPNSIPFNVAIENHFATSPAGKYSSFYARALVTDFTGEDDNFQLAAGDMTAQPNGLLLTSNNLDQQVSLSFLNLSLTGPGKYKAFIYFYVDGVRVDSGFKDLRLSTFRVDVELVVLAQNSVSFNVDKLVLSHIKTEIPLPAQQFEILSSVDYHIFVPEYFELSGGNLVELENTSNSKNKYRGNGRQIVNISLNSEFDFYENKVFVGNIGIQLIETFYSGSQAELVAYLLDAHEISADKDALEFFSIKDVRDASMQELEIVSSQDYTVTTPFFMQVSPLTGSSLNTHIIKPIAYRNLVAGDYEGVILFESANAILEVPVILKVVESIDAAFNENALNFTDDNEDFTNMYSNVLNVRASLEMAITSYNLKGFPKLTSHPFKLAFFNSKVEIHLGEIMARRFNKINQLSELNYMHYDLDTQAPVLFEILKYAKPCVLDIKMIIERRDLLDKLKSKTVNDVPYIKGRRPAQFSNDYGILSYDAVPIRVTRKSQMIFNFVRKFLDHDIVIKRNNVIYKTVTHTPGSNLIFGMRLFFKDFSPGDVIDVELANNASESFVQQYVVFPDQAKSHHLVYVDEYNVLASYECTGEFRLESSYENITSITYAKLVAYLENVDSSKEQTLIINTGWILKSNQIIVDAIIRSKRVWLAHNNKEISLTPITNKMTNEDSEEELYQYDLEFKINLENDSKVYTS